jgi:hypothetical protein
LSFLLKRYFERFLKLDFFTKNTPIQKSIKNPIFIKNTCLSNKEYRKYLRSKRSCFFPELEEELDRWIVQARANGTVVTGARILCEAKIIATRMKLTQFMGSNGWLTNFLKRHVYSLRRISSKQKELPMDISNVINKFHSECREKRVYFSPGAILNADETSVDLDSPSDYTYEKKGTKKIWA